MNYKLLKSGVQRLNDGASIPPTLDNIDWVEYQKWLALGNTPVSADPDPVPTDHSDIDMIEKQIKALALVVMTWNGKTKPQLKVAFKTAWDSLP